MASYIFKNEINLDCGKTLLISRAVSPMEVQPSLLMEEGRETGKRTRGRGRGRRGGGGKGEGGGCGPEQTA